MILSYRVKDQLELHKGLSKEELKNHFSCWRWWHSGGRGRWISMGSSPACFTDRVTGQPTLHKETLSQKKIVLSYKI